jgi:TonB family protein
VKTNEYDYANGYSSLPSRTPAFTLTLLQDAHLSYRLCKELRFACDRLKVQWPRFRKNPFQFSRNAAIECMESAQHAIGRPATAAGLLVAIGLMASLVITVAILERHSPKTNARDDKGDLVLVTTFNLETEKSATRDRGVGAGDEGRVGFARGAGEGSRPQPARSQGGGAGGTHSSLAGSQGRPPVPSIIPATIPTAAVHLPRALPVAGIDLDPALWRKLDYSSYGDPRSKSPTPSNGSGDGGGVGSGNGTGIGEGEGAGFGPGRDGNMGGGEKKPGGGGTGGSRGSDPNEDDRDRVYPPHDVGTRARVISKPEPQYTEQARRNQVTGTVVLRVIFSSAGEVTNIQAVQKLGDGLTEKAIAAAREIRFVPAMRNGRPVSIYMQLEYNFNLY